MKRQEHKVVFLLTIALGIVALHSALHSQVTQVEKDRPAGESMVITSDSLEIDNKEGLVIFTGNVDARNDSFIIRCQKMRLYYNSIESGKPSTGGGIKVDRIVATGSVKINRIIGGEAEADEAIYYQKDEKLVLTGSPVVKQGPDFVEGSKITLFLRDKKSIVEGSERNKVRAVLSPGTEKRMAPGDR